LFECVFVITVQQFSFIQLKCTYLKLISKNACFEGVGVRRNKMRRELAAILRESILRKVHIQCVVDRWLNLYNGSSFLTICVVVVEDVVGEIRDAAAL